VLGRNGTAQTCSLILLIKQSTWITYHYQLGTSKAAICASSPLDQAFIKVAGLTCETSDPNSAIQESIKLCIIAQTCTTYILTLGIESNQSMFLFLRFIDRNEGIMEIKKKEKNTLFPDYPKRTVLQWPRTREN
jgi:hypothetical protein